MKKSEREEVYNKYDGHCAYCGEKLKSIKDMQVDHIIPKSRFKSRNKDINLKRDSFENYNPSCPKCNHLKATFGIKGFRKQLLLQVKRGRKTSSNFRFAEKYGLISINELKITFYFERKATPLDEFIGDSLAENAELKDEYDSLDIKYQLISKLVNYRKKNNLTQKEFAEKIGLKQQAISRFEQGGIDPRSSFIQKILNGIDAKMVFDEKGDNNE